jgi:DNA gyrase subunit B
MDSIQWLKGIEGMRLRPEMYVGCTTSQGLHHLIWELVGDSLGEVASAFATHVRVILHTDGSVEVQDDGRPFPTHPMPSRDGQSFLEFRLTEMTVGARTGPRGERPWIVGAGGLHGCGICFVNALSESFHFATGDGERVTQISFERGKLSQRLQATPGQWRGCRIRFKPDPQIFPCVTFSRDTLAERLSQLAAMVPSGRLELIDEVSGSSTEWCYPNGVAGYVSSINADLSPIYEAPIAIQYANENFRLDVALQHVRESKRRTWAFVNTIYNLEGGTHWTGFRRGLKKAVNDCLKDAGLKRIADASRLLRGMTAVVSIWVDDPMFEGPTRTKFQFAAIEGTVASIVYHGVKAYLSEHPDVLCAIAKRAT